ncbi:hypothetical protein P3342_007583 [Pyrenophora teres f. teres]|nr:hypothetical protein P3342_007583 [Pyrenophora teres f. teres]
MVSSSKKDKGYRLINNAQKINGVTIRDANPPPNPDEFSEEFAGCAIMSLMDFFSGYDQVELHKNSRDITAFSTPLGLVRQCTLPMGTTNSIAEFVRVMTKICRDHIPNRCMPYLDDVCVKGPKTTYDEEEIEPGIRRYVAEHLSNMDQDRSKRQAPGYEKVEKILTWPKPTNQKDVRMFIGVCVYYRIWIIGFAMVAEPLFLLLRKNALSVGNPSSVQLWLLKESLCTAPALVSIDYSEPFRAIFVAVDGSKKGWGAVLMQLDALGRRHPIRYESGVWSMSERNWDSGKHECKALLLTLKKFRSYMEGWEPPEEPEEDVEDFIDAHLNATQLILEEIYETTPALLYGCCPADLSFSAKPLDDSYSEESQQLAAWILFRKRPENLNRSELRKFKHKALRMTVRERHLFTLPSGGRPCAEL